MRTARVRDCTWQFCSTRADPLEPTAWDKEGDRVAGHDESKTLKIWLARQASSA